MAQFRGLKLRPLDAERGTPASDSPNLKTDLLKYLKSGSIVTTGRSLAVDELDPDHKLRVPVRIQTDGVWVWSSADWYYLEHYDLFPEAEFIQHVRARGFMMNEVSKDTIRAISTDGATRQGRAAGDDPKD